MLQNNILQLPYMQICHHINTSCHYTKKLPTNKKISLEMNCTFNGFVNNQTCHNTGLLTKLDHCICISV